MNMNLRQAVLQRVQNKDENELSEIIRGSVAGDERSLPGLGVLFEVIWQNCDASLQNQLVTTLKKNLPIANTPMQDSGAGQPTISPQPNPGPSNIH